MIMKFKTLAIIAASSAMSLPAFAADPLPIEDGGITDLDTLFGTSVTNTASLSYTVPGATAPTTTDSNSADFKVDRKVIFALTNDHSGSQNETVAVGDKATTIYTLTNNSNAPIDYLLPEITDANTSYSYTRPGTTDTVTVSSASSVADRTISLTVGDNAPTGNDVVDITVAITVPASKNNGETFDTSLSIVAIERTAAGTAADPQLGTAKAAIVPTSADTEWKSDEIQTVTIDAWFVDGEIERSDSQTFTVQTAIISLKKEIKVIWDPITKGLDAANDVYPKAIPGAIIEYTLTVINKGPASASEISVSDDVVTQLIINEDGFDPKYTVSTIDITPGDTTDPITNANLIIAGQELTFSNISVAADSDTADNIDPDVIYSSDGTTVITFTVKLK